VVSKSVHDTSVGQFKGAEQLGYGRYPVVVRVLKALRTPVSTAEKCSYCEIVMG